MSIVLRAAIAGFLSLIFMAPFGSAWGADRRILGVSVSPDLKTITIKCDGPVDRHSSFVIQRPYRLVLDLESTALGTVPARISVGRRPITEIRLGHSHDKARVAIDFGDNVVPPFKIEKAHNNIVVRLSVAAASVQRDGAGTGPVTPASPSRPSMRHAERVPLDPSASGITVKNAGISNNMVYLDLATQKNPNQPYRLVIDLDADAMLPKQATVSDWQGNLKKFEVTAVKETFAEPARPAAVGPRKSVAGSDVQDGSKKKFKWGLQSAAQSSGRVERPSADGIPFRLEEFKLQKRQTAATAD
jgi:hypothetical protein